jgi:hypothetical protein
MSWWAPFYEIKSRRRKNLVQARSFAELLEQAIRRYQNLAVEAAQVIEELIAIAKVMREADRRGEALGLSEAELAFYDELETNDSAVKVLGEPTLRGSFHGLPGRRSPWHAVISPGSPLSCPLRNRRRCTTGSVRPPWRRGSCDGGASSCCWLQDTPKPRMKLVEQGCSIPQRKRRSIVDVDMLTPKTTCEPSLTS